MTDKKSEKDVVEPVSNTTVKNVVEPVSNTTVKNVTNTLPKASQDIVTESLKRVPVMPLMKNNYVKTEENGKMITGFLDLSRDGHGVLRASLTGEDDLDAYISTSQIRRFGLRAGDIISGPAREPKDNERFWGLLKISEINGMPADEAKKLHRAIFNKFTPVYPDSRLKLEINPELLSLRIIDMIAPIGKGQRSLIVSPPKAGKTTLLKDIATGVAQNHPEVHVMAVLVGERPEEVTDIKRHIARITDSKGEVASSNFDESAVDQCRVAELALERAKRLVEEGKDVLILLDSITRLARAYNLSIPTSGRTLSGGFDPAALFPPKKFFGAARNFETPGSLTIVGTALVETGSRMDDLVYEEFKGTGNQEIHLDRRLAERRIFPSIDVQKSGTRRDDLLIDSMEYLSITTLHRMLDMLDKDKRTSTLIQQLKKTKSNKEFLASLKNG
ncbi:MAG: transcription termination factor Rho [Pseudomonadales bacterium]|nr:transcription termination factor Rho [Pseudomonadales bacterium]